MEGYESLPLTMKFCNSCRQHMSTKFKRDSISNSSLIKFVEVCSKCLGSDLRHTA